MQRVTEPELMDEALQVMAYATADFEATNGRFIELFQDYFAAHQPGRYVLDLGCGPGDITLRFAEAYPACIVHGLDGSAPMLRFAHATLARKGLPRHRVQFIQGVLPDVHLPRDTYHVIISNGLLHHLHDPGVLWQTLQSWARPGTLILIRDLIRPQTVEEVEQIVAAYSPNDPEVLQRDFYNSLRAAFRIEEIESQLRAAGLEYLAVHTVSDRHLAIMGIMR